MNSRPLIPLVVILLLIAAGPLGEAVAAPPSDAARGLLDATRSQKARTGLGLPHYRQLLGSKRWEAAAKRADASFAGQLTPPAPGRIAASQADAGDPLGASDSIKGRNGRQTRKLRVAAALESGCPAYQPHGAFELKGTARGDYEVTTVERIGRYDVTTVVVFDVRFEAHSEVVRGAKLNGIGSDGGTVTVTRSQTARDRKTGKKRRTGPTQRLTESLSPLLSLDGDFEDFVEQQDRDERPAPRRPMRSAVWRDAAQRFVAVVFGAAEREFAAAEQRLQTANACVALSFEGPERLAPSQATDVRGILRLAQGEAPPEALLKDLQIVQAEYVNEQGQRIEQLGGNEAWKPGDPWYRFTAPPQAWPDAKPVGLRVVVATRAGIADATIAFKAQDGEVYFRIVDANVSSEWSASSDDHWCGTISGRQRFGGPLAPRPFDPQNAIEMRQGRWSGFVNFRIDAAWTGHHVEGCKTNEMGQRVPCAEDLPDAAPRPDGTFPLGFRVRQEPGSSEVELLWAIVDPTVGYLEPDEEECYVYLAGRVPAEEKIRRVPVAQLLTGQPVTLTFAGSIHLSETGIGGPASIDHSWTYTVTIQRVGPDGQPLG